MIFGHFRTRGGRALSGLARAPHRSAATLHGLQAAGEPLNGPLEIIHAHLRRARVHFVRNPLTSASADVGETPLGVEPRIEEILKGQIEILLRPALALV